MAVHSRWDSLRDSLWVWAAPAEGAALAGAGPAAPDHARAALGVGKTAAAVALGRKFAANRPARVIAIGVCGAHRQSGLAIGDVVLVGRDAFADEGVQTPDGFLDLAALGLGDAEPLVADGEATARAAARIGARIVDGQTVSTCSGTDALAASRWQRGGAEIETMEGAAIAEACRAWDVPWIGVRAVSNYTGDRAAAQWDLQLGLARLTTACATLLEGSW